MNRQKMCVSIAVFFLTIVWGLPAAAQCPCSIWAPGAIPGAVDSGDGAAGEYGIKIRSDVNGFITGVRFYKSATNTGVHIGNLWSDTGTLLASATFMGESASGWQQVNFSSAVPITAGTTYVASYYTSAGHYSFDQNYFGSAATDNPPLHALANGTDGPNAVYSYGPASAFPVSTYNSSNYWVDVVFNTVNAPYVTSFSPIGTGVSVASAISATFSSQLDPTTVNTSSVQLLDGSGSPVSISLTYNASTNVVTAQPSASLTASTTYTVVIEGGPLGLRDVSGNPMAANFTWQFATAAPPPPTPVCPCSIWPLSSVPGAIDSGDSNPGEYGVKFRADVDGSIIAVRFYKTPNNTGTHIAHLWTSTGQLLATATSTSESSSGWQQVSFSAPVFISAGTTYVASYYAPSGHYSFDAGYLQNGVDAPPMHAIANTVSPNGVYSYAASSTFPVNSFNASNYWVDAVFMAANSVGQPAVSFTAPKAQATGVSIGSPVSATFNEPMNASSFNSSSVLLLDSSSNPVPGTVSFDSPTATVTFTPSIELSVFTMYTATIKGTVKDSFGNTLGTDYTWSFTTGGPPSGSGPGGPVLVISSLANPYTNYYDEILRAEGLNEFSVQDIAGINASILSFYHVAILGDMQLTSAQASMLSNWVMGGGNLIAMHPDKQLAGLLGLNATSGTLSNAYLLANTKSGPGVGIVPQTIQFHGTADLYTLNSASSLATFYSNASTATAYPAVTLNSVGAGQAAAFTYDLARSIIYTRQGNPAWVGQERIGLAPIRTSDLFYGNAPNDPEPNWIDLNKVQIPQADEQQRLLVNLVQQMSFNLGPLPRFWYFPNDVKAVVVMTGDDHNQGGTPGRFDEQLSLSTPGCSVPDWQCVRSTSYMWSGTPISDAQVASYVAQGFEVAPHMDSDPTCSNWISTNLNDVYTIELATWVSTWPSAPAPVTHRMHCISWSDWDSQPIVELLHGMRLDTNYYWFPDIFVQGQTGMFTGSGMPMRFADRNGKTIDVYQATTQLPDEDAWVWPDAINILLDNATGPLGYYGVFTNNMHNDFSFSEGADAIIASAQARGVPLVTSRQMLTWLDGRNSSYFGGYSWSNSVLSFSIVVGFGARNLNAMVPVNSSAGGLSGITVNGTPVSFWTETIKGIQYAFFNAQNGDYQAFYGGSGPTTLSGITLNQGTIVGGQSVSGTVTLSGPAPASGAPVTLSSSNTGVAQVPSSVLINGGASSANFTVTTVGVATATTVTITGTYGAKQAVQLTVTSTPPVPSSIVVSPTSVVGGNTAVATVTLNKPAPTGGAIVTLSSNSATAQVPASVTVPSNATTARFNVTTSSTASTVTATLSATLNGITKTTGLTVTPPGLSTLSLNPTSVVGGTSSTGTVTLTGPAPSGGLVVSLSDNNAAAQTPATVTVPANASSASFTISTTSVSATTLATISATYNGTTRSATLTINPWLASLAMSPTSVAGGNSSTGTVTLNAPAPSGGIVVTLSDNNSAATTPASVTVAANARTATFPVTTTPVSSSTTVTVSASYNGTTRTASFTITPPGLSTLSLNPTSVVGGNSSTGTVTLTGPAPSSGLVVNLSDNNAAAQTPPTVTVPANASSASFTITTTSVTSATAATITSTYNGTTRTAVLTVNPWLASVSMSPTSVVGGISSTGTVTLNAAAPAGGIGVSLSDNNSAATTPASVTVPANASTATFTVTTTPVSTSTTVTVSATYNGTTRTALLTVTAPSASSLSLSPTSLRGGGTSTGTVTLNGVAPTGGRAVTLSSSNTSVATVPANVTVAAGSRTATFAVSTRTVTTNRSVTIAATATTRVTATLNVTP